MTHLIRQAEMAANRVRRKNPVGAGFTSTKETHELIRLFPIKMRQSVLKKAVGDGGRVVARETREQVKGNQSIRTGTREQWSKNVKSKRSNIKGLYRSIRTVTRDYKTVVMSITGARWPGGAHAHLLEFGGMFPRWGKKRTYQRPRPFMRPAIISTRREQERAVIGRVKKEWKNV